MKILHVVSCCLLSALCVVESAGINVKGVVAGQVKIKCSHTWAGDNEKYFCKIKCYHRDRLVQTEGNKNYIEKGRYTIEDLRNGVSYVTIKNLRKTDSGTYWCGVERYGPDTYQEVHLTVTDGKFRDIICYRLHDFIREKQNGDSICGCLILLFYTQLLLDRQLSPPDLMSAQHPLTSRQHYLTSPQPSQTSLQHYLTSPQPSQTSLQHYLTSPQPSQTSLQHYLTSPQPSQTSLQHYLTSLKHFWHLEKSVVLLRLEQVDCVYEEIREADRQTDTLPVVISSVNSTVNSPTNSTTYPAGQAIGVPHCDIYANASCHKDDINPSYSTADHPDSLIYSNVDLPTDSRVSSSPSTASGTQDDSIYSTAQIPKDTVESTRYPAVHLSKDTPEDALYSTAQLPKDTVESTRYPAVHLSKDTPEDALYSTAQLPKII
ncbi:uncharacterized protein LOC116363984 isoform X2 [Oncorhynchus kisutch]|uniref:Integrator complex subunit 6 homolog n=1 Tax=Oncorhynchus kisutch TaxID=8019 RepID=A0A8C7N070_ONCKI|nr:uncharacterized protein LOC116363984 isoform X2 [Oncorhynchus kisutch]